MKKLSIPFLAVMSVLGLSLSPSSGGSATVGVMPQWTETGATRDFFNKAASMKWKNSLGDWKDAEGKLQGDSPFAETAIADTDKERRESWDVSDLVDAWISGKHPNNGFLLRGVPEKGGTIAFFSREADAADKHPRLTVEFRDGHTAELPVLADTYLDSSTVRPLGTKTSLKVGGKSPALLRFDLAPLLGKQGLVRATLELYTTARQYGAGTVGVFHAFPGGQVTTKPPEQELGIATFYREDRDIEKDQDVLFADDFEGFFWKRRWSEINEKPDSFETIDNAKDLEFRPLLGKALKIGILKGSHRGLHMVYLFDEELGEEPESIYFRYYLRLAEDWNPNVTGGKFPGIAGTYNRAGWGGRRADGKNGWSMRGSFSKIIGKGDSMLAGRTPIGTYAYFADMPSKYGEVWPWSKHGLGVLERNKWYCIEQHVRLNDPGRKNGVFRVWIDGYRALDKTDVLYRTTASLKIDRIWMNVYHGGTAVSPHDQHVFVDNVVVARDYIGPMMQ